MHGSEGGVSREAHSYPYVRLWRRFNNTVKVRIGVCHNSVAEGNCVAARRGGKQPEAKEQSVG